MDARLRTGIWVQALVRRVQAGGAMALVARKGDPDAGAVLVKVLLLDGRAQLYVPARTEDGARAWAPRYQDPVLEADMQPAIESQVSFDPDIWVVEIEDREGRHFLTEPVLRT